MNGIFKNRITLSVAGHWKNAVTSGVEISFTEVNNSFGYDSRDADKHQMEKTKGNCKEVPEQDISAEKIL